MNIVIASVPIYGHVYPLLTVATQLGAWGVDVRFVTGRRFADQVSATGARFVPLPDAADFDDRAHALRPQGRRQGISSLRHDVEHTFVAPALTQYQALQAESANPTDGILVDPTFLGAALMAGHPRDHRPAVICGSVLPLTLDSVSLAPFGLGLPPRTGLSGRIRNTVLRTAIQRGVFGRAQRDFDRLYRDIHGRPSPSFLLDAMGGLDAIVQFTVPQFEYPRPDAPADLSFAGPLRTPPVEQPLPHWWPRVEAAKRVVVVTQGTIANHNLGDLVLPTVHALSDRPDTLVVVATGGPAVTDLGDLPANTVAAEMIDFDRLLPRADVYVTNGGYGGVHAALRNGVPVVVAGVTEDKPEVAARVAWSGVGIDLRTGHPSTSAVRGAVQAVFEDPSYRDSAKAIADVIANTAPIDTLWAVIEAQVRRPSSTEVPS